MAKDERDILDVLKFELDFIEKGGYGRSVRTPWLPTSIFQDSMTCLNFGDPKRSRPCNECNLQQFVPPEHRSDRDPCRHIPLNQAGETISTLEGRVSQERLEEMIKDWLRATIQQLEAERARGTSDEKHVESKSRVFRP